MIIAFVHQKGGVGKTTLSTNVAGLLASRGERTLLVDGDPQHSILDWAALRDEDPYLRVVGMPTPILHREVPAMADDYGHIVIESPPRLAEVAKSALACAHVVVVPVQPSPYDVWALDDTLGVIREASVFNESLKAVVAINRRIVNTTIGKAVYEELRKLGLLWLEMSVAQRVIFPESAAVGKIVSEVGPDSLASAEIQALTNEILGLGRNEEEVSNG